MPLVSIVSISYNHEKFIRQTLDGFVMQKTNFPFEVIIADDASTDGTQAIIREYAEKYPDIIKPVLREKNTGSGCNFLDACKKINAKYVATCEGDDYFTDPCKLQKQVDFLEANPGFSVCFHPVKVIFDDNSKPGKVYPSSFYRTNKSFGFENLLNNNFMQTCSVMYRWRFNEENIEDYLPVDILPGDWFLHLLHAEKGYIGCVNEIMSVYRRHGGGLFWDAAERRTRHKVYAKYGINHALFYKAVSTHFKDKLTLRWNFYVMRYTIRIIMALLKNKEFDKLKRLMKIL